jgi:hypothetical protein
MKKRLIDLGGHATLVDLALSSVPERLPNWALHGKVLRALRSPPICRCRPVAAGCDRQVLEVYDSIFWEGRLFLGTWPAQPELQGVD